MSDWFKHGETCHINQGGIRLVVAVYAAYCTVAQFHKPPKGNK